MSVCVHVHTLTQGTSVYNYNKVSVVYHYEFNVYIISLRVN